MGRHAKQTPKLSTEEVARAFEGRWGDDFPPVLNVSQAARLAHVPVKTIYEWSSQGRLDGCAGRPGKRLLIFRDRFIKFLFENTE